MNVVQRSKSSASILPQKSYLTIIILYSSHTTYTHTHTGAQKGWGVRGKSKKTEFEVTCGGVFAEVIFIIF